MDNTHQCPQLLPLETASAQTIYSRDNNKDSTQKTNATLNKLKKKIKGKNQFMTNQQEFENANYVKPNNQGINFFPKQKFQKNGPNFEFWGKTISIRKITKANGISTKEKGTKVIGISTKQKDTKVTNLMHEPSHVKTKASNLLTRWVWLSVSFIIHV